MKTMISAAIFAAALAVSLGSAGAVEWLDANGRSCDQVCAKGGGGRAVGSGQHTPNGARTGQTFYVCAADMNGWRGGYNLQPSWSNVCMVGYGGKEVRASPYRCACQ